ncbi:MAG: ribonuclease R [Gammaproteobacteria bacterium]|nr:ribonuclease R [Gammaproteobacteria bacterium]
MSNESNFKDPYAEREKEKYDNPVPSREIILDLITTSPNVLDRDAIIAHFGLSDEEQLEGIRRRLKAMERDGQLVWIKGFYHDKSKFPVLQGTVSAHQDGFGFLLAEDGGDDIFLNKFEMQPLFHGDRVSMRITGEDRKGKRTGFIDEVIEHHTQKVVGRYTLAKGVKGEPGRAMVKPDHKKLNHDIFIEKDDQTDVKEGEIIVVEITQYPGRFKKTEGVIVQVLGEHMAPGQEIDIALRSHKIPFEWPQEVDNEIASLKPEVEEKDKQNRLDLRALNLVTIDGEDAKDFDDAVYAVKTDHGWNLKVAIADVSHYVERHTALDMEALNRGTSVYFPGRVIPMLPEILSNGLCSLNPNVDRLCMVCEIDFDQQGNVLDYKFHKALMNSSARLTYTEVAEILEGNAALSKKYADVLPDLHELYQLYQILLQKREQRGAIDFDTTETRIIFCENKKIDKIVPVIRNEAHRLIEECMLAANVCAANYLIKHKLPALFRNHDGPTDEKLSAVREMLGLLGLTLKGGDKPSASDYAKLLKQIIDRPDAGMIQTSLLRSMSQAVYEGENSGHFGLSFEAYAHFTSPIRRYPDLLVHRAIKYQLDKEKYKKNLLTQTETQSLGEHCSTVERRADEATRDVNDWLKCEYMLDKVGEEFSGIITTVTAFGLFIEVDDIHVEGLLHVTALKQDYYVYSANTHVLKGERTGQSYHLGEPIKIKVAAVSLDDRKIDFVLAGVKHDDASQTGDNKNVAKKKIAAPAKANDNQKKKKSKRRGRKMPMQRR